MKPVWGADSAITAWVEQHIGGAEGALSPSVAMGVAHDGKIVAGVVFHDWTPRHGTIEISAAATDRRWFTRRVSTAVLSYAFSFARLVVTRTSENNASTLKIWRALGARETRIPDLWAEGEAMVVFTLSPEGWAGSKLRGREDG